MDKKIYNIPAGCSFLDTLVAHFLTEYQQNPLGLADVLFLLPNRRACKSLADAFVRYQGLKPTLLPQMQPLADAEEDELLIKGFDVSAELENLPPAISSTQREMMFTKIIMAKPADYGVAKMSAGQAAALAKELGSLMDLVYNQELSFDNLQNIVPDEYAAHWQETLKFLTIITQYWPSILEESGKIDACDRRNRLLQAQIRLWQKLRPAKRIVIAGTTAAFPLMKELVKTVSELDNGEVFLSGLDKFLSDEDWAEVDESHPQYELKNLLEYLDIDRQVIPDFVETPCLEREKLVSEIMRPAKVSNKWRNLDKREISENAVAGIKLIEAPDARTEALSVALLMRETLSYPEKTAALITTDRTLARRVAAELKRWDIQVDDSAGVPLSLTPVGIFLRQILEVVEKHFTPVVSLALMKYPLYANGEEYFDVRKKVRAYERFCLRAKKEERKDEEVVFDALQETLKPLADLYQQPKIQVTELIRTHLQVAEKLATTAEKTGDKILWKGEAGETAARFMADLLEQAEILGEISPFEYANWLSLLMSGVMVRNRYGMHPRLKILGPIEARLMQFDRVIIGEVNETVWPQPAKADPWMSRPMKRDFGLPLPEKNIGVQAADFSSLLANREVFLTRAQRVLGTPMVKSRWWMRLETVLQALDISFQGLAASQYSHWAVYLDKAQVLKRLLPPAPKPPVKARPRQLSASSVEQLMRDPYIIFAKHILKLKPLDELEQNLTFADYGTLVHAVLEEFNKKYDTVYPENAREELICLGEKYFAENHISSEQIAFWRPNFLKIVDWLVDKEAEYRKSIAKVYNEIKGQFCFEAPAGEFVITAKADRIDITKDHKINILDYKTGQVRSAKEIEHSYAPQLPIEALIAEKGGFEGVEAAEAEALIYWQLGRKESGIFKNVPEVLQNTYDRIVKVVSLFDFEDTPYLSKPNPKYAPKYSDYEHLSRINEITLGDDD